MATSPSSRAGVGEGGESRLPAEDSSSRPDLSLNWSFTSLPQGRPLELSPGRGRPACRGVPHLSSHHSTMKVSIFRPKSLPFPGFPISVLRAPLSLLAPDSSLPHPNAHQLCPLGRPLSRRQARPLP